MRVLYPGKKRESLWGKGVKEMSQEGERYSTGKSEYSI